MSAADQVACGNLLRCWVRETGGAPLGENLVLRLDSSGTEVIARVEYASTVGWHRFGPARLATGAPLDSATLGALLAFEAAQRFPGSVDVGDFVARLVDSTRRIARHLAEPPSTEPITFLSAEQALTLGHPLHPTPKSREGMSAADAEAFSPELRGSFALHWFAADPSIVVTESALDTSVPDLFTGLHGGSLPAGTVAVPAHPWQARDLLDRAPVRELLDAGLLHDLGPSGPAWYPTSSLRTVYRPDAPVMLKLSLGVRITNSRRENLRNELYRGALINQLLRAGLAEVMRAAHPGFSIVRDPAWLGIDGAEGLDIVVRDNPFRPTDRVACVAGFVSTRPDGSSMLAETVRGLAGAAGRSVAGVAVEWFARYLDAVLVPVLWLHATHGLGLEAHQQNTVVALDGDGWPVGGHYRDNQGYYFSPSRCSALDKWLPGGEETLDASNTDEVVDERLGYYIGINNLLGMVGALGSQGLADEDLLLEVARRTLIAFSADHKLDLVAALLDAPTLRCKANLLTQAHGMDELVGPVETQSVYVDIKNPLVRP
jgi:siderophore synthetase component